MSFYASSPRVQNTSLTHIDEGESNEARTTSRSTRSRASTHVHVPDQEPNRVTFTNTIDQAVRQITCMEVTKLLNYPKHKDRNQRKVNHQQQSSHSHWYGHGSMESILPDMAWHHKAKMNNAQYRGHQSAQPASPPVRWGTDETMRPQLQSRNHGKAEDDVQSPGQQLRQRESRTTCSDEPC